MGVSRAHNESDVQEALWQYLNKISVGGAKLADFSYHVPNGIWVPGQPAATARIIASLKRKGFRNGVSDIVIALPVGRFHGAHIELKRDRKSKIAPEQIRWLILMQSVGHYAAMAFGLDEAILRVQEFLLGKDPPPLPSA